MEKMHVKELKEIILRKKVNLKGLTVKRPNLLQNKQPSVLID